MFTNNCDGGKNEKKEKHGREKYLKVSENSPTEGKEKKKISLTFCEKA